MHFRCLTAFCQMALVGFITMNGYTSDLLISGNLLPGKLLYPVTLEPGILRATAELQIAVLSGKDGINVATDKTTVQPVIEVRDENSQLVAGAVVTFTSPSQGPGTIFVNGSRSLSLVTDSAGRTAAASMKTVGIGAFKISVSASFHGQVATAEISQMNVASRAMVGGPDGHSAAPVATGGGAGVRFSARTLGVMAVIAAAAAVGVGLGLAHLGSNSGLATTTTTIAVGSGASAGPPH